MKVKLTAYWKGEILYDVAEEPWQFAIPIHLTRFGLRLHSFSLLVYPILTLLESCPCLRGVSPGESFPDLFLESLAVSPSSRAVNIVDQLISDSALILFRVGVEVRVHPV